MYLKDRTTACVSKGIRSFLSTAASRSFECKEIRTDGEGAVAAMIPELNGLGIPVSPSGPGQHVSPVERLNQEVKKRVRSHEHGLPFVMCKVVLIYCVLFCMRCINLQPSSTSIDRISPMEQFSGLKLDASRDLRVGFGDYLEATVPNTNNTMAARTEGCLALSTIFRGRRNPRRSETPSAVQIELGRQRICISHLCSSSHARTTYRSKTSHPVRTAADVGQGCVAWCKAITPDPRRT